MQNRVVKVSLLLAFLAAEAGAQTTPVWTQRSPQTGPSARYGLAMAYDSAHAQVVLFGGLDGRYNIDTWVWDGANWTNKFTQTILHTVKSCCSGEPSPGETVPACRASMIRGCGTASTGRRNFRRPARRRGLTTQWPMIPPTVKSSCSEGPYRNA